MLELLFSYKHNGGVHRNLRNSSKKIFTFALMYPQYTATWYKKDERFLLSKQPPPQLERRCQWEMEILYDKYMFKLGIPTFPTEKTSTYRYTYILTQIPRYHTSSFTLVIDYCKKKSQWVSRNKPH